MPLPDGLERAPMRGTGVVDQLPADLGEPLPLDLRIRRQRLPVGLDVEVSTGRQLQHPGVECPTGARPPIR